MLERQILRFRSHKLKSTLSRSTYRSCGDNAPFYQPTTSSPDGITYVEKYRKNFNDCSKARLHRLARNTRDQQKWIFLCTIIGRFLFSASVCRTTKRELFYTTTRFDCFPFGIHNIFLAGDCTLRLSAKNERPTYYDVLHRQWMADFIHVLFFIHAATIMHE